MYLVMCHEKKRLATDFVEHKELSQTCHVWTPGECRAGLNFAFYMRGINTNFTEFHLWCVRLWCRRLRSHGHTKFPR